MGQYIQEGKRILFETVINVENSETDMVIKKDEDNIDGLNFLTGKTMSYINQKAMEGTIEAHVSGGVPNILINIQDLTEVTMGELIYFFELACAMSCKLMGVNPFDQPGVEAYKNNMFRLLGKPGYVPGLEVTIEMEEEKPKRRSKPKKEKDVEVGFHTDPSPETTPKKRGRPKKEKLVEEITPKKRGRPRKVLTEVEDNIPNSPLPNKPKRGRRYKED